MKAARVKKSNTPSALCRLKSSLTDLPRKTARKNKSIIFQPLIGSLKRSSRLSTLSINLLLPASRVRLSLLAKMENPRSADRAPRYKKPGSARSRDFQSTNPTNIVFSRLSQRSNHLRCRKCHKWPYSVVYLIKRTTTRRTCFTTKISKQLTTTCSTD